MLIRNLILTLALLFAVICTYSQTKEEIKITNLRIECRKEMPDTQRLNLLLRLGEAEKYIIPDSSIKHFNQALIIAQTYYYSAKIAKANYLLGVVHSYQSELIQARDHFLQCLPYFERLGDQIRLKNLYYKIGRTSYGQGSYSIALKYFLLSLQVSEELSDSVGIADGYHRIAKVYESQKDMDQAIGYNRKALAIRESINFREGIAASCVNLGLVLFSVNHFDDAFLYAKRALALRMEKTDEKNHAEPYELLGKIHNQRGDYLTAIMYYKNAIRIWKKYPDSKHELANNYIGLGRVFVDHLSPIVGIAEFQKGLKVSEQIGNEGITLKCYLLLFKAYKKIGDQKNSLRYLKLHAELSASLINEKNRIILEEMELENSILQQEKEIELLKKDAIIKELRVKKEEDRIKKRKAIVIILMIILLLALITGFIIYNSYRLKNRTNILLMEKNKIIKKHSKDIADSINYAYRIQNAFFVSHGKIKEYFPDSFVLFKPKDIVSGDFYWLKKFKGKVYFAAADCTGQGVRGALVSIICQDLLNHALDHHPNGDPGTLLAWTSQQLMDILQQRVDSETGEFGVKDGMDIALCCMDTQSNTLTFAGSHAPLYMIRGGKLTQIKGDNNFVGRVVTGEVYDTHTIPLEKGDRIYLFSDGYSDQKGGPKNKKFYQAPFQKQLVDIHQKPMDEQKEILNNTLIAWQGNNNQVDDILVFGLKIKME